MAEPKLAIARPQRWDVRFGEDMTDKDVTRLLSNEPFKSIDPSKFPAATPLRGIMLNDTRIVHYSKGDLVVREGDYGSSAFLIMRGSVRVTLQNLPSEMLGRRQRERKTLMRSIAQLWTNPNLPEVRKSVSAKGQELGTRSTEGRETRIFLQ